MIGNSHIDPVWFWDWDEGLQEVKATFSSALDRMREDPEMTFTATSSVFFEWIEQVMPDMFQEIKQKGKEGRLLLTGGWFIEPDCMLPCGEAFVRQGLYGQRYFEEKFGKICKCASNVDSFGHTLMLPQILKKSGMDEYVFMRPRLKDAVFEWESPDGSKVRSVSLPSEYTTWFLESMREAIQMSKEAAQNSSLHGIPCCYGVGNHGGGPTKENIKAVYQLRDEMPELELVFSGYEEFFSNLTEEEKEKLPVKQGPFDKVNTGCYSMDGELKRANRFAEKRLLMADFMKNMELTLTGKTATSEKKMKELWKILLFNQFHDTLGGTAVKSARDEAIRQLGGVYAQCKKIWTYSLQNIVNSINTEGEGFPLFLFNPSGQTYKGYIEAELNWFCKDGLTLCNEKGEEIPYQRVYTEAKARNYNLGGRRGIVFYAEIPAGGFQVYRTLMKEPTLASDIRKKPEFPLKYNKSNDRDESPYILENEYIRVVFSQKGYLCSLYDKKNEYETLAEEVSYPIWKDERDTWGSLQGRVYENSKEQLEPEKLELVESGNIRKVVRAVYRHGGSRLTQLFILYKDAKELEIKTTVFWDKEWKMLRMACPLKTPEKVAAESAYGTHFHTPELGIEYSMHRFADVMDTEGRGLCIVNDGKYAYIMEEKSFEIPLARSSIFAQGNGKDWYNPVEGYAYGDLGQQTFSIYLSPHGKAITQNERYNLAEKAEKKYLYLADNIHTGIDKTTFSLAQIDCENVRIMAVKKAEEEDGLIFRLMETDGIETKGSIQILDNQYSFAIGKHEILTLKYKMANKTIEKTDLLEKKAEG